MEKIDRKYFKLIVVIHFFLNFVHSENVNCDIKRLPTECIVQGYLGQHDVHLTDFFYYNSVQTFTFINSSMNDFPPSAFSLFSNINHLNCVKCGLQNLTKRSFTSLPKLVSMDLSFGTYKALAEDLFIETKQLQQINMSNGVIAQIDENAFQGLTNLTDLDLSKNSISKITAIMFSSLENLTALNLSFNHLSVLDQNLFINNQQLKQVFLQNNQIVIIDTEVFNPQTVLELINLSNNNLSALDTSNIPVLKVIISNNRLSRISISKVIKYLDAEKNQIGKVFCDEKVSAMETLLLRKNYLKKLDCISKMNYLKLLDLSENSIGALSVESFADMRQLETLKLHFSNLSHVENTTFLHQHNLKVLDLSYNFLGNIPMNFFSASDQLETLYLDGNNMTEFYYSDVLNTFKDLKIVGLGDNDFNCTYLEKIVRQFKNQSVEVTVRTAVPVNTMQNVNGIGCKLKSNPTPIKVVLEKDVNRTQIVADVNSNRTLEESEKQILLEKLRLQENFQKEALETIKNLQQKIAFLENALNKTKTPRNDPDPSQSSTSTIVMPKNDQPKTELFENEISQPDQMCPNNNQIDKTLKTSDAPKSSTSVLKILNIIVLILICVFCLYKGTVLVKNNLPRLRQYTSQRNTGPEIELNNDNI